MSTRQPHYELRPAEGSKYSCHFVAGNGATGLPISGPCASFQSAHRAIVTDYRNKMNLCREYLNLPLFTQAYAELALDRTHGAVRFRMQ